MARYNPPRRISIPWGRIVTAADPTFYKDRTREAEYEFTKRTFWADQSRRGNYGLDWDFSDDFSEDFLTFAAAAHADNGFTD